MSSNKHVIDHCNFSAKIQKAGIDEVTFLELVMKRAGEIIASVTTGQISNPHEFAGVELVAFAVAMHVIDQGAAEIASDLGINIEDMKKLASSKHISD